MTQEDLILNKLMEMHETLGKNTGQIEVIDKKVETLFNLHNAAVNKPSAGCEKADEIKDHIKNDLRHISWKTFTSFLGTIAVVLGITWTLSKIFKW